MKLTKGYILKLIKEELSTLSEEDVDLAADLSDESSNTDDADPSSGKKQDKKLLQHVQRALDYAEMIDNKAEYQQFYGPILQQMMKLPQGVTAMDVADILRSGLGDKLGQRIYQMIKGETEKA